MKSPAEQKIVQIDITNACPRQCSNCTRHSGHHARPFFMGRDVFEKAVESLRDHPGMIGIMGGEPTLHPRFEELMEVLRKATRGGLPAGCAREPIADFAAHADQHLAYEPGKRRGLFTSLGSKYYEHFEVIQDTFPYQCINDHRNPGLHQALLVARQDLGIGDDEWISLRDKCWIQNLWSASITPKGCFFCEVAGSLDMLFDGPGGWPIEPGWWRREPCDFGDQLRWCELCGAALQVPRRRADEEIDDISPRLHMMLEAAESPKLRKGRAQVIDVHRYRPQDYVCRPTNEWYLPDEDNALRVADTGNSIRPRELDAIVLAPPEAAGWDPERTVSALRGQFDRIVATEKPASWSDGAPVNAALRALRPRDWVLAIAADAQPSRELGLTLRKWVLNPGCLYEYSSHVRPATHALALPARQSPLFLLFNVRARALRGHMPECWPAGATDGGMALEQFRGRWPRDKRVDLHRFLLQPGAQEERRRQGRQMAVHAVSAWQMLQDCGGRLALFGAGRHTRWLLELLADAGLNAPVLIFDDTPSCRGMRGVPVVQPRQAAADAFDTVVVSADPGPMTRALEARARHLWAGARPVVTLYRAYPEGRFRKLTPEAVRGA